MRGDPVVGENPIELSVIVVSWNVARLVSICLKSILDRASEVQGLEVFLVDNASADETVAMVRREYPQVQLIHNAENRGFAAANNQALLRARGEYILLLNPDTEVRPGCFRTLIGHMKKNPRTGMAGPRLESADGITQRVCARRLPTLWSEMALVALPGARVPLMGAYLERHLAYPYDYAKIQQVEAISGAAMMIRRSALDKAGLLDEAFFHCGEDIEWCDRIRKAGFGIEYVGDAAILHYGEQSTRQNLAETNINAILGIQHYYAKAFGLLHSLIYEWMMRLVGSPEIAVAAFIHFMTGRISWRVFGDRVRIAYGISKWQYVGAAVKRPLNSDLGAAGKTHHTFP